LARALRHHASSSVSQYVKWLVSARPLERSWGVSALMLGPRLSFKNRRPIAELMCACIRLNVSQDRANVIQLMQRTGGWKLVPPECVRGILQAQNRSERAAWAAAFHALRTGTRTEFMKCLGGEGGRKGSEELLLRRWVNRGVN